MITITPISSVGTRDKRDNKQSNNKYNDNKAINTMSFEEFMKAKMEQQEQV
jgi:hypothetical protein